MKVIRGHRPDDDMAHQPGLGLKGKHKGHHVLASLGQRHFMKTTQSTRMHSMQRKLFSTWMGTVLRASNLSLNGPLGIELLSKNKLNTLRGTTAVVVVVWGRVCFLCVRVGRRLHVGIQRNKRRLPYKHVTW